MFKFSRLFSLFFGRPTPPPKDADTIPCSAIDLQGRDMILTYAFVVNRQLDCEKLRASLFELVETKFRKAGARLALRNRIYEFQIPRSFSADVPPVAFTHSSYNSPYASPTRPAIPRAPVDLSGPSTRPLPDFTSYVRSPACPTSLSDFLKPNVPLVHVHVTTFEDLTFFGITSTHLMFDVLGARTLLEAWTTVLKGDSAEIENIRSMPWDFDPFAELKLLEDTRRNLREPRRGWYNPSILGWIRFIMRSVWRQRTDAEERRIICVPKKFVMERKAEVMADLAKEGSGQWVGSSDVLVAWWFKVCCILLLCVSLITLRILGACAWPSERPHASFYAFTR